MTTAAQTRAIHALLRQIPHFSDEDYRALLAREFHVKSSSALSERQAAKLIEILKALAGQHPQAPRASARRPSETVSGPYAGKLRALWISAYNLGVIDNRDDRALIAFAERQTKIAHPRFLQNHKDAKKVIEALKAMMTREAYVQWPESDDVASMKREIARCVAIKCLESGAFTPLIKGRSFEECWASDIAQFGYRCGCPAGFEYYRAEHWDLLANRLGARLRAKRAKTNKAKKDAA